MKRLTGLVLMAWALVVLGSLLSCKSVTPAPVSSVPTPAVNSPAETPPAGQPQVIKPVNPPTIWWGPRPTTTERFMGDMKKYYPDWYKWFSAHPEDIGNYFGPSAQSGDGCQPKKP